MSRETVIFPTLGLVAVLTLCSCAGMDAADDVLETSRVAVTRDGNVIGTRERFVREVDGGVQVTSRQTMRVATDESRPLTLVEERTRTEDGEQNTIALQRRSRIGRFETVTTAEISDTTAIVHRQTPGEARETTIDLPQGLRFDNGAGLIADWDPSQSP